jgi:hypothetical protein
MSIPVVTRDCVQGEEEALAYLLIGVPFREEPQSRLNGG